MLSSVFSKMIVSSVLTAVLAVGGFWFVLERALQSQDSNISSLSSRIDAQAEMHSARMNEYQTNLSKITTSDGKQYESISNIKSKQIQLIELAKEVDATLKESKTLSNRIEKLLENGESIASYSSQFDSLLKRLNALEEHFVILEDARPYIDADVKLPESVEEKQDLMERIRANTLSKDVLAKYIIQDNDYHLAEYAATSYFSEFSDADIDFTIKIYFSLSLSNNAVDEVLRNVVRHLSKENVHLVEKPIFKYANDDYMLRVLLLWLSDFELSKESLVRIRNFTSNNEYLKSSNAIDSLMVEMHSQITK